MEKITESEKERQEWNKRAKELVSKGFKASEAVALLEKEWKEKKYREKIQKKR